MKIDGSDHRYIAIQVVPSHLYGHFISDMLLPHAEFNPHLLLGMGEYTKRNTLKVESFEGRNFPDFANFLVVRES